MKASNQTKQVQVVTIEIEDPAEVAALRAELTSYNTTTGGPSLQVMARLARVVVEAISPMPTTRTLSPVAQVLSDVRRTESQSQESRF